MAVTKMFSLLYNNEISDRKYIALSTENNWKLPRAATHTSGNTLYAILEWIGAWLEGVG